MTITTIVCFKKNCWTDSLKWLKKLLSPCTSPSPFSSAFTWSYLIDLPLMFGLSVKSNAESCSPAEVLPLSKQSLLCVWNWRGQHSSLQASNKDPDSCRNNPGSHWECKPIPWSLGCCLPQGGQSVSLWSQADANKAEPRAGPPGSPHSCCLSYAYRLPCCVRSLDYLGEKKFAKKQHQGFLAHHQCWIIRVFMLDYGCSIF